MSAKPTKYIRVFIGRFQPFHNGHLKTLRAAIDCADLVVVVVGSVGEERSFKNPWGWVERRAMILFSLTPAERKKVKIVAQNNCPGDDKAWVRQVKSKVKDAAKEHFGTLRLLQSQLHVTLVGCHKGADTYYLKLYRGWNLDLIPVSEALNATDIRKQYFVEPTIGEYEPGWPRGSVPDWAQNLPPASAGLLYGFLRFNLGAYHHVLESYLYPEQK